MKKNIILFLLLLIFGESYSQPQGGNVVLNILHKGKEIKFKNYKKPKFHIKSTSKDFLFKDLSQNIQGTETPKTINYIVKNTISTINEYHLQIIHISTKKVMDIYLYLPQSSSDKYLEIPFKEGAYFVTVPMINKSQKRIREIIEDTTNNVFYNLSTPNRPLWRVTNITPFDWEKHRLNEGDSKTSLNHLDYVVDRDYEGNKIKSPKKVKFPYDGTYVDSSEICDAKLVINQDEVSLIIIWYSPFYSYKEMYGKLTHNYDSIYSFQSHNTFVFHYSPDFEMDDREDLIPKEICQLSISECAKDNIHGLFIIDSNHPQNIVDSINFQEFNYIDNAAVKSYNIDLYSKLNSFREKTPLGSISLMINHTNILTGDPIAVPLFGSSYYSISCATAPLGVVFFTNNKVRINDQRGIMLKKL